MKIYFTDLLIAYARHSVKMVFNTAAICRRLHSVKGIFYRPVICMWSTLCQCEIFGGML